jgi:hypothetical protein
MAHTNVGLGDHHGASDEPIELNFDEMFADDELDEHGAWCVDDGSAILVMSTQQIRDALASGRLSSDLKTWRDGHACWLPIHDQPELCDGFATPAPVVVDLDAAGDERTVVFTPPGLSCSAASRLEQQAAQALRAGVLVSLALLTTIGSMAWSATAARSQPVLRARHLDITVPSVVTSERDQPPRLSWSPPFDPPMSGFRRRASR